MEASELKIQAIDYLIDHSSIEGDKNNFYNLLTIKALTHERLNQPTESLKSYLQAKQLIVKDDKDETYADLLYNIGGLYSVQGLHSESTKYFEEALRIMLLKSPGNPLTVDLMESNGDAYAAMLSEDEVSYFYQQIL